MSYCINPKCTNRENSDGSQICQSCRTALLICDRYRIIKPVRSANPALPTEIFAVTDWGTEENQWGTVKVLKVLKYTHNPHLFRLFKQEARALIWLAGSTGIPQVEPDGYFTIQLPNNSHKLSCLVMEKIEGETLAAFLNKHKQISPKLAIDWLQQLTNILEKIHKYHLVHRDIKPSNLMIQPKGKLRLIDFGAVGEAEIDTTPIGSAGYCAPEQIIGNADVRSDFFAMGRTFVHLLTGIPPLDFPTDETTGKINWRNQTVDVDNLLADFIDELMEPLPETRPENSQVILEKLKTISLLITSAEPK
ncbi:MAG TPA: serine/threonine protein kinase [Microcoleaceae bacterium UBA10368]|jgi:Serine/threonine protein kinase|nr:serine/threonine protein kinase [Microcoleaceae cyanobacterium UBA10368]HCV30738.1 serine/threonine protein kinase [Microcoleaceae cyanobacterium UBA9251]